MKLKFVKLIRVPIIITLPDGTERHGYRYMDIDGNIIAESLKQEVYPSAIRELELEMKLEAQRLEAKQKAKEIAEQEAQEAWDAMRAQMQEAAKK